MAVADFTNPKLTQDYTTLLQSIRDLNNSQALLHDSTGIVNVPTNTIRWYGANNRFEKYDGTNWGVLTANYSFPSATFSGAIVGTYATFRAPGTVLYVNSSDSAYSKVVLQDSGTTRGYIGANATNCFAAINSANTNAVFTVDNGGFGNFQGGVFAPTLTASSGGIPVVINSTTNVQTKIAFQNSSVTHGYIGSDANNSFRVTNSSNSFETFRVDQSGNIIAGAGIIASNTLNINNTAANTSAIILTNTNTNGVQIGLYGNGTTPNKTIRVLSGRFELINSAYNNIPMGLDDVGNVIFQGNVTAYSDERVKTNWQDVPFNFLHDLANVKSGIYDRTDVEKTQVGVSAQSLQKVLPHAVETTKNSFTGKDELSVAYGNAALVSAIELAKEIISLKEYNKTLEARLIALENK